MSAATRHAPSTVGRAATTEDGLHMLTRPRVLSLSDLAYQAIVEVIVDRRLAPGARLNIDRLAEQLGMSATPVREALARAVAQRLVIQDNNRGFTVAPLLDAHEYHQLFEFRHLLETHAVERARPQPADVERLAEIVSRMPLMGHGPDYRDFGEFNRADLAFHHELISTAHNSFLSRAWTDLHFHLHVGRLYAGKGVIDFGYALREHSAIVDALQRGNQDGATRAASYHIEQAEKRLRGLLPSGSGP